MLSRAFGLAYFIHGNKETAARIAAGALAKLEVATAAQEKRLYYTPNGRSSPHRTRSDAFRNKVYFNELHLLQRLVYIESEPYEKQKEQARDPVVIDEEAMIIHFVKHLVKTTIKRNSFYVTLGLSRLLYNYTTADTMEVYNAVIQDPERVKDDYYYRSRKGLLMQELKERFGGLLDVCRGPRGEERFRAVEEPARYADLIERCLNYFTPWNTPCLVPAGLNPITDGIPCFACRKPDEEDKIEVNRMHAILHPECYGRLTRALGLDDPSRRLEVPQFFLQQGSSNETRPPSARRDPPALDEEDLLAIRRSLAEQSARRRAASAGLLRIVVDGNERAQLDARQTRRIRFAVEKEAELIEIRAGQGDGDLLLASHLLARHGAEDEIRQAETSIILEGGQKLSIAVTPAQKDGRAAIDIAYRETHLIRATALLSRQLVKAAGSRQWRTGHERLRLNGAWTFALVGLIALACALGLALYMRSGGDQTEPLVASNYEANAPASSTLPEGGDQKPGAQPSGVGPARAQMTPEQAGESSPAKPARETISRPRESRSGRERAAPPATTARNEAGPVQSAPAIEGTRSLPPGLSDATLSQVKKIYVEAAGEGALSQDVRAMIAERLQAGGRFTATRNRDEADALLKVTLAVEGPEQVAISARLINAAGRVIWSGAGRYVGSASVVTAQIARDLLAAAQQ
jgi:hypothetical protein